MENEVETEYACPRCYSRDLFVYEETCFVLNTGEFFCHSVKLQDSDAKVTCGNCDFEGRLLDVYKEVV